MYLDRFMPFKIMNMIYDVHQDSITDYNHRKEFLTKMEGLFSKMRKKVIKDENGPHKTKCMLRKAHYFVPKIEIPKTLTEQSIPLYGEEEDEDLTQNAF